MGMKVMEIDGERLHKALDKRGLMVTKVSEEIGRGGTYITDCIRRNAIPTHAFIMLNKMYNITEDEVKQQPKEKVVVKEVHNTDYSSLESKFDKMIALLESIDSKITENGNNINKIGNIEMQKLDYVLKIKNELVR